METRYAPLERADDLESGGVAVVPPAEEAASSPAGTEELPLLAADAPNRDAAAGVAGEGEGEGEGAGAETLLGVAKEKAEAALKGDGAQLNALRSAELGEAAETAEQVAARLKVAATAVLGISGAGDLLEQSYIAISYVQSFSLFTVPNFIDWPDEWLGWFDWLHSFSFGLDFGAVLPGAPGLAFAAGLLPPVLVLGRFAYMFVWMENLYNESNRDRWVKAHVGEDGWRATRAKLLRRGLVAPLAVGALALGWLWAQNELWAEQTLDGSASGSGQGDAMVADSGSGSDGATGVRLVLSAQASAVGLAAGLWAACGTTVLLFRYALKAKYTSMANQAGGTPDTFFQSWAASEGNVLLFLYSAAYLGPVAQCLRSIAEHEGDGFAPGMLLLAFPVVAPVAIAVAIAGLRVADHCIDLSHQTVGCVVGCVACCAACGMISLIVLCAVASGSGTFTAACTMLPFYALVPPGLLGLLAFDTMSKHRWLGDEYQDDERFEDAVGEKREKSQSKETRPEQALFGAGLGLVGRYEAKYWWTKPYMLVERGVVAATVTVAQGSVRLWLSVALAASSFLTMACTRPYLGDAEDRTDVFGRLSNVVMVGVGAAMETKRMSAEQGKTVLAVNSVWTVLMFAISLGPFRVVRSLARWANGRRMSARWASRDEEHIRGMAEGEVLRLGSAEIRHGSPLQLKLVLAHHLDAVIKACVCDNGRRNALADAWGLEIGERGTDSRVRSLIVNDERLVADDKRIDLARKGIDRVDASLLAAWLKRSEVSVAIEEVNISMNSIGVDGAKALGNVISGSSLKCLIIGPKGTRLPVNDGEVTELNFEGQEFSPVEVTLVAAATSTLAAVERVILKSNRITGSKYERGEWKYDLDMSGFTTFCEALPAAKTLRFLDLSECRLSVKAVNEIAKAVSAGAGVARLSLGSNPQIGDEAMVQLLDALKDVSLTSLDISSTGCGISTASKLAELLAGATKFGAAVYEVNIGMNPIGIDGAKALGDVISGSSLKCLIIGPKGTRLPVNNEDVTQLNFKGQGFGPVEVTLVAAAMSTLAALNSLRCGNNPGMVGELDRRGRLKTPDVHAEVFKQLTDSLKTSQVTEVDFSSCGIGAVSVNHLSDWVRDATAAVESIDLSGCGLAGATKTGGWNGREYTTWEKIDSNMDGFIALCAVLGKFRTVQLAGCGLGARSTAELAKVFHNADAASVEVIKLDGNPIGCPSKVSLKPGAETGVAVKEGVFAAVDERFGKVTGDPDDDQEIKLRWLDDGSVSKWIKAEKLTSVVASRTDLIEDYSHIQVLGEALSEAKVKQISLADTMFSSATLTEFVQSVRWETAVVADLNISEAVIGDAGATLVEAISTSSSLKFITIGKGLRLPLKDNYGSDVLDAAGKGIEAGGATVIAWWLTTSAAAALNSLRCGNNPGMVGDLYGDGYLKTPDAHAEVFKQLTDSLKTSQVTDVDFSSCGIGAVALGHLSDWVRDATAAVVDLNISINPIGVDGAKALGDVISGSSLKCLIIGPKGTRLPVNDGEVTELNFEGQKFSPVEVTLVAAATSTLAALTEVDVRGNKGLDKAAVDALRAAAPETCKILAD
eukprot:COSAG06_NODE_19_length_34432_cov_10.651832_15_plen_1584_part_00